MSSQFLQENAVGNSVKGFTKVQVDNIHSLSLIHYSGHLVIEGDQKALTSVLTRTDVATQTELPQKHAATQLSGCRECQSLSLVADGSSENGCVRCDQVDDLLSLVAELHEEVERLRSIREAEREIDWWNQALPSLRQKQGQPPNKTQGEGDPVSSPCQAEGSSLKEGSEWKQVHARRGRRTFSSLPTLPSHVPLCNRYEALAVEGHSKEDMDDSQATPEVAPRPKRPMPRVVTTPTKKKRGKRIFAQELAELIDRALN
ncbi:hypothetical protein GRJ2_003264300 [Grus japonensis]|uniref:Uncharacterized protein n=1 Tax=Grus japonensis TaxID=30415 RepID=A0ABC9YDI0_GRUJA